MAVFLISLISYDAYYAEFQSTKVKYGLPLGTSIVNEWLQTFILS